MQHGHGPKNLVEFQRYLAEEGRPHVQALGIADLDGLFTSDRDGKPFVIVYGIVPAQPLQENLPLVTSYERQIVITDDNDQPAGPGFNTATHQGCIVAYEQVGDGSRRRVCYLIAGGDPSDPEELAKQQVPGLR